MHPDRTRRTTLRRSLTAVTLGASLLTGTACAAGPSADAPAKAAEAAEDVEEVAGSTGKQAAGDAGDDDPLDPKWHQCTEQGSWTVNSAAWNDVLSDVKPTEADLDRLPADAPKPGPADVATLVKAYEPPGKTMSWADYVTNTPEVRLGRKIPVADQEGTATSSGMSLTTEPNGDIRMDWHMTPATAGCQGGRTPTKALLAEPPAAFAKLPPVQRAVAANLVSGFIGVSFGFVVAAGMIAINPALAPYSGCVAGALGASAFAFLNTYFQSGATDVAAVNGTFAAIAACGATVLGDLYAPEAGRRVGDLMRRAMGRTPAPPNPSTAGSITPQTIELSSGEVSEAGDIWANQFVERLGQEHAKTP